MSKRRHRRITFSAYSGSTGCYGLFMLSVFNPYTGYWLPIMFDIIPQNSVVVKDNRVLIREFGLLQLCGQPVKAVHENLPWCAPELLRATKRMQHSLESQLACTRESDIYSYGERPPRHDATQHILNCAYFFRRRFPVR